jgi:hypothetical protein
MSDATFAAIVILRSLADRSTATPSAGACWLLNAALHLEGRTPAVRNS